MAKVDEQLITTLKTLTEKVLTLEKELSSVKEDLAKEPVGDARAEKIAARLAAKYFAAEKGDDGKDGYTPKKGIDYFDGNDGKNGYTPKKGIDYFDGKDGKDGKDGYTPRKGIDYFDGEKGEKGDPGDLKDLSPDEIRNALELLEDDDRLDVKAIKGIDEYVVPLVNKKYPNVVAYSRGQVKFYDLSSSLNGSTTTFSLPAFWRVFDVKLSSIPTLRQTVDYTVDGSAFTITFTSQINAATDLASGQSLVVLYVEP